MTHPLPGTSGAEASARVRFGLLVVLVLALLASSGALIWLLAGRAGDADQTQRDRETVMSQAEQFMLRLGNHGPADLDDGGKLPDYRERLTEITTTKFIAQLEPEIAAAETFTAQSGLQRESDVFGTGVETIDPDSATVLVAGAITDTFGEGQPREPISFRYAVRLVKVEGAWLVDGYDKAGEQQ